MKADTAQQTLVNCPRQKYYSKGYSGEVVGRVSLRKGLKEGFVTKHIDMTLIY